MCYICYWQQTAATVITHLFWHWEELVQQYHLLKKENKAQITLEILPQTVGGCTMQLYNVLYISLPVSVILKIETEHQYTIINYLPWPSNTKSSIKLMDSLQCHLNVGIFTDIYIQEGGSLRESKALLGKSKQWQ